MTKIITTLLLILYFISNNTYAQQNPNEKYANRIDKTDLAEHLKTLTSSDFEGRRMGTEGGKKAMQYVISKFKDLGIEPADGTWFEQYFKGDESLYGINIIGKITGTEKPDEYIIVCAHYDGLGIIDNVLYESAEDNAAGCSALIEIANAFADAARDGYKPRRTIVFIAFDGSKQNLAGANHFVKFPLMPLRKTLVVLNMDMIGRDDCNTERNENDYVFLLRKGEEDKNKKLADSINEIYTHLKIKYDFYKNQQIYDLFFPTSDQFPFASQTSVPVVFYTGGINVDTQSKNDIAEKISIPILRRRAQLVFHTAWIYANN